MISISLLGCTLTFRRVQLCLLWLINILKMVCSVFSPFLRVFSLLSILVSPSFLRVQSWSSKLLSYGGGAQLINAVLFSIQVYWSSTFILPFKILAKVESSLKAFFWRGSDKRTSGAKVKWESVCKPRNERGLGFRLLEEWNRAAMVKHIRLYVKKLTPYGLSGFTLI